MLVNRGSDDLFISVFVVVVQAVNRPIQIRRRRPGLTARKVPSFLEAINGHS